MTLLDAALEYAAKGWPVMPVAPGDKKPLTAHGLKDATVYSPQIEEWWTKWPDANIGIPCGRITGAYVLDVDPRHGGDTSLEELCPPTKIPDTLVAQTGGGGHHYWFSWPENGHEIRNATDIMPGLDIRGEGGYVVAPPSRLASGGEYVWEDEDHPPAPTPEWLEPLLNKRETAKGDATGLSSRAANLSEKGSSGPIPEGRRDQTLTQIAGAMRRYGSGAETILSALREENKRCQPPLEEADLERIAGSVSRYAPASSTEVHHYTDLGNAGRLVDMHGEEIRFCYDWNSWLIWDGTRWKQDTSGEVSRLATDVPRSLYLAAAEAEDKTERQNIAKFAAATEGAFRLRAMVELARSQVPVTMDALDSDPYLLTVENGTVDLRTGELREADPGDLITKSAAAAYDPAADAPKWRETLFEIFDGDAELTRFVQKAAGYSLTGDVSEQCLFVLYGTGSNGKSTFLSMLQRVLGDYGLSTPPSAILATRNDSIPNDIARLRGIRFTTLLEVEQGRRLAEPMVKAMTGGDVIAARFLHGEFFDFTPEFKLWLGTNHKPRVLGQDTGIWRRIRLIPFTVQIPEERQDKHLFDKLQEERSGILNWLIEGCLMWQQEGLKPPVVVQQATESYRSEEDVLGDFLEEKIEDEEGALTASSEVYQAYTDWCEKTGEKQQSQRWLTMRLEERGYDREKTRTGRLWRHMRILE